MEKQQKVVAEYIWISDPDNSKLRSRTYTLKNGKEIPREVVKDGIILLPKCVYSDPLHNKVSVTTEGSKLILCETTTKDDTTNTRQQTVEELKNHPTLSLAIDQDFILRAKDDEIPLIDTIDRYCHVGTQVRYRQVTNEFYDCCLKAGLNISSLHAESVPYQWKFRIGLNKGIESADDLWLARYILLRLGEKHNLIVDFSPNPFLEFTSGCNIFFSTDEMRSKGQVSYVEVPGNADPYNMFLNAAKSMSKTDKTLLETTKEPVTPLTPVTAVISPKLAVSTK